MNGRNRVVGCKRLHQRDAVFTLRARPALRQIKGGDAVVASSPAGAPAVFDLSAGDPLGLKGLGVALRTMKRGEKAALKLSPECERRAPAWKGPRA